MEETVIQNNGRITIKVDVSVKKVMHVKKYYIWNPATCCYKNGTYLASFMDNSVIICDEDMEFDDKIKTIPTNFNEDVKSFYFTWIL